MKLIAILLVLATEEKWRSFRTLQPFHALIEFAGRLRARFGASSWFNGPGGVVLAIAPGVAGVALFQAALDAVDGFVGWLVGLAFAIAVLIACIGRRGADEEIDGYRDSVARGDHEGAYLHVRELLPRADAPASSVDLHRQVLELILVRNHERLLAMLFWFVVLGPVGAVLYRSSAQLKAVMYSAEEFDLGFREAVLRLQAFLDWIPVRITALCQALVGSFSDALTEWRIGSAMAPDLYSGNRAVLVGSGLGSLRLQERVVADPDDPATFDHTLADTRALVYRMAIIWVTVFAALTIVGWLS
ncbi:MAG: regulatory signaling modulator protein AmpE [Gammaproteobacteria bacterium]|jgi:membrane protein required for beta-lactamase induction|nr:regulatory signaling modulator protein AmpE [Gammaproteobacteria bacterium]